MTALSQALEAVGAEPEIELCSGAPHAFAVIGSQRCREKTDKARWTSFAAFLNERLGG